MAPLSGEWLEALKDEFHQPYYVKLYKTIMQEYRTRKIFPPADEIFNAFHLTPLSQVKVVILGQDPYHNDGQAQGLCFSVREDVDIPPSLVNIYQELHDDLGCYIPDNGNLEKWARQGVLLLNTVLTVRAHQANSHRGIGWEQFTDAAIRVLADGVPSVGKTCADEKGDAEQPETPDPGGAASKSSVGFPRVFRMRALQQDKPFSDGKRPGTHRLAD